MTVNKIHVGGELREQGIGTNPRAVLYLASHIHRAQAAGCRGAKSEEAESKRLIAEQVRSVH